jgi:glucose-1-phosphate cytidylyltransferase
MIKEYFMNYFMHNSDVTIDLKNNKLEIHETRGENFKVTLVDTGVNTKTAGRLRKVKQHVNGERFMLTYGDGLTDLNIKELVKFHEKSGRIATLTSIQPAGRFGSLEIEEGGFVKNFVEKPKGDGFWINGGFFVLEPGVFDFISEESDEIMWEEEPLSNLAEAGQLSAFKYQGFWKCMDHLRDKVELEKLWMTNSPPWKTW